MILALVAGLAMPAAQLPDQLGNRYLVEVAPGPRRYFHKTDEDDPRARFKKMRAYVVAGDWLVASDIRGGHTRVTFVGASGRPSEGWIETATLTRVALPPPRLAAWQGQWQGWDASIAIRPGSGSKLRLEGEATWGGHDPERVARGGIHIGDFLAELAPAGDRIAFSVGDESATRPIDDAPEEKYRCRVRLRLLGPYLLAEDNNACGGANVTFTGIYRRR